MGIKSCISLAQLQKYQSMFPLRARNKKKKAREKCEGI